MKKILLLLICCILTIGCSSVSRSNTLQSISLEPEIELQPIVADLRVLEQKVTGLDSGIVVDSAKLKQGALTKALGHTPPSADKPDVLVGMNVFTELTDNVYYKVTVTGYPAYYTNFRTAKDEDLERLNITKLDDKVAQKAPAKQTKPSHFGVRLNGGPVFVSGDEWDDMDGGYSFGLGAFKLYDLDLISLNIGASVAYKSIATLSYTYSGRHYEEEATEISLEIPVLLRYPIGPLYAEAGIQVNLAFLAEIDDDDYDDRNFIDLGIALGVGYNITKNISVDARYFFGLITDVDEDLKGTLHQITFGANFMF